MLLGLMIVLLFVACAGENTTTKTSTTKTSTTETSTTSESTSVDRGDELSASSLKSKAENYVRKQFSVTTYGGYKITDFKIVSSKEHKSDDLYAYYTFSGTYDFINKYGEKEHKTWDMNVKVYKWSKNPDNKTEVKYY